MASRQQLHTELEKILGSKNVYFQPPASVKMQYPAIRYSLKNIESYNADDLHYKNSKVYELILIDSNPDNTFVESIMCLPYVSFDRFYPADNLNHYVFTIYY